MPRRAVNLALLIAVPALAATGLLAWAFPEPSAVPLLVAHRVAGVALVLGLAWKYGIARRSLRRRAATPDLSLVVGALASVALLLVLGLGLAWTVGLVTFDRPFTYSLLNVHVFAGTILVPLVLAHAAQRWERRPPVVRLGSRRHALRVMALGVVALAVTSALDHVAPARRVTGSRHAGSFSANDFPLTIWNVDSAQDIAADEWKVSVTGAVARPGSRSYADLSALPMVERDAVIDCTGGWWSEQRWRGVTLAELIAPHAPRPDARAITVISVTGHAWAFPIGESSDLVLATHVGGEALSAGHGAPARLVAPGRRGFQWIKWVARVDVS